MNKRENSQWRIPKYRYRELRAFCLQYPDWIREASIILNSCPVGEDPTGEDAVRVAVLRDRVDLVSKAASQVTDYISADGQVWKALLHLVTRQTRDIEVDMVLGSDIHELYQMFFWHLDRLRD